MIGNDGMTLLYVPAGEFTMGSNDGNDDEKPVHTVYLDAYWIDQTKVTNKQYAVCVRKGVCTPPSNGYPFTNYRFDDELKYYGKSQFDDYPVLYVDWNQVAAYCEWAGRRLPTEAEWEKASRGTDGRTYPWGENQPSGYLGNFKNSFFGPTSVRRYPDGVSPYGAYDMAGNVEEWVNDWYDSSYYQSSPSSNPLGPNSGDYRVVRGGWWNVSDYLVRSAVRSRSDPTITSYDIGFRCARSP